MIIPGKYLLFLGDVTDPLDAKTAFGLVDWSRDRCVGQWRLPSCTVDLGLEDMDFAQARAAGAQTLVIGVAPFGGAIADAWITPIVAALEAGFNVASGMAQDDRIGLRTVEQAERHPRIGGMEQRALPFDDVPMIAVIVG
jgi:uncharacterized NAD-dependent epimerase/dehydratase family protein